MGIIGLFLNSLLAATAIPLPTEILTSALIDWWREHRPRSNCIDNRINHWRNFKLFHRIWR